MEKNQSVRTLKGVGEKAASLLEKLGILTIADLLEYFPRDYEIFQNPQPISSMEEGKIGTICAGVSTAVSVTSVKRLQISEVKVVDDSGMITLKWFHMPYLRATLKRGMICVFRGKCKRVGRQLVMDQPKIYMCAEYEALQNTMQPQYSLTAGVTNNLICKMLRQVLDASMLHEEFLPDQIRLKYDLAEYNYAIENIHFPKSKEDYIKARKRLAFDEFFLFTLALQQLKGNKEKEKNHFVMKTSSYAQKLLKGLPYELTGAQMRVWKEVQKDIAGETSMNRLIQGDVGSGKTVLALLALLTAVENGYQGALMAPTEVLAKQHYESISELLEENGIQAKPVLLTGSMTAKEKRIAYEKIERNEAQIVIGTHALIQEKVHYQKLALVITDEQHRFGVRQREALSKKGEVPHILVMSATPIPRTLAVILYGDLDISVVDELPAKRLPIKNCVVTNSYREKAYAFIEKEVRKGRQVYVICPLVEESENAEGENVLDYTKRLQQVLPKDICVEYLHGKMKGREKNAIMEQFAKGAIQVLVSTTVIEVGVNVPNATVMMIENAEKFGLAQLHQLRGRVGRGKEQSYCIFMNGNQNDHTSKRLEILKKSNDGFFIASEDLKLRGPGDLFGIRQSGILEFKVADIYNDANTLEIAAKEAKNMMKQDPELVLEEHQVLKEKTAAFVGESLSQVSL